MSLLAQNASLRGPWCLAAPRAPAGCAALTFGPCKRRRQAAVPAAARSAAGGQKQRQLASSAASSRLAEVPHTADALSTASSSGSSSSSSATAAAAGAVLLLAAAGPALAFDIHPEPANALSLPTWAVHTSSVVEWITAMGLMWRYGEVSGNPRWKGMAWGMLPCLGSAMCACTWHLFFNAPELQFLVALQAFLTVVGNFTCWWAAYRIYQGAQEEAA